MKAETPPDCRPPPRFESRRRQCERSGAETPTAQLPKATEDEVSSYIVMHQGGTISEAPVESGAEAPAEPLVLKENPNASAPGITVVENPKAPPF